MNRILSPRSLGPFLIACLVLAVILGFIFSGSFRPSRVVFSNDGPLAVLKSDAFKLPDTFRGYWSDLHWLGVNGGVSPASITYGLLWMLGPVGFAKFYPAFASLLLGLGAWAFFRSIGLKPALSTVAGIAAALNSNYFSNACWGLGSRSLTLACIFLALAALSARRVGNAWINAALAGLATGMAVVEGADNGVIFSLFVAAFVVFQSWVQGDSAAQRITKSLRLILVAGFAGFIATQSLIGLFSIAAKTSVTAQMDEQTKEQKWAFATQWSLPPLEMLRVIIPGLYGYRMDTPDGGSYWGRVGEAPGAPEAMPRFSGAGEYAGVLVVLLAAWTLSASSRKSGIFTDKERKLIWFWAAMFVVAMLLSWGRFAKPVFYKLVYALPYFSSIRNPMKFMHAGHMILIILFGYGLLGLSRRYLEKTAPAVGSTKGRLKLWWAQAQPFEKKWTYGMFGALAASMLAFLLYSSAQSGLVKHLMTSGFPENTQATQIAKFSIAETGRFFVFFLVSSVAVLLVMGGVFAGRRANWAAALLGLLLTADLARANAPWIIYWDYKQKYATNSIIDVLRENPHQARVVAPSFLIDPRGLPPEKRAAQYFPSIYGIDWVQQYFPYYNIQSIDVSQDPRPPADKQAYTTHLIPHPGRYWELTNTRFVLGMTAFLDALNSQMDKGKNRFRIVSRFDVTPRPGVASVSKLEDLTVTVSPEGALALFEFTGALPRAKLYTRWQVHTNDEATLKTLTDPAFDPHTTVIVADEISPPSTEATNAAPGTVEITRYSPCRIELRANAAEPGILLLNDRYDQDWRVRVDGQSANLLRSNFIMRGVQVPAGQHTVVFEFRPSMAGLQVSLAAIALGGVLCVFLIFLQQPEPGPSLPNTTRTGTAPAPKRN